jgi:CRISPR-associated endonuclease Csn1
MKTILGLDLGTNSIGWALVDKENKKILGMGSRIIPMSQDILGEFGKGNSVSQTAERTGYRGVRRLRERHLLRRERLHRVLNVIGFLPTHYADQIDFDKRLGQYKNETETKIAYKVTRNENNGENKYDFIFKKSFEEMLHDFRKHQPKLLNYDRKIPYDWTIYYLRKKAITQKIEKEELAWVIFNFNQKRGYYQLRDEEEDAKDKREYVATFKIVKIEKGDKDKKK